MANLIATENLRPQLARMMELLEWLRLAHGPMKCQDLAERLNCSTKTVRREVDILRELGFNIVIDFENEHQHAGKQIRSLGYRLVNKDFCPFCTNDHRLSSAKNFSPRVFS